MRRLKKTINSSVYALIVLASACTGCAQYRVSSNFNPDANFTNYATFAFIEHPLLEQRAPLVYKRIERVVAEELVSKALVEVAADTAELLVGLRGVVEEKIDVKTVPYGLRGQWQGVDVRKYTDGTLVVDIVDREQDNLVWRGIATSTVPEKTGKGDKKLRKIVKELMEDYPPGSAERE